MPEIAGPEVGRPTTIDEVTPEWLTAVLRTSGEIAFFLTGTRAPAAFAVIAVAAVARTAPALPARKARRDTGVGDMASYPARSWTQLVIGSRSCVTEIRSRWRAIPGSRCSRCSGSAWA